MIHLDSSRRSQSGFTVVELLIATVVFSTVLIIISSGIIHFTAEYYKSVHVSSTQTAARNTIDIIAQGFQYGSQDGDSGPIPNTNGGYHRCIGNMLINYQLGKQYPQESSYGVYVSTMSNPNTDCVEYGPDLQGKGRELLATKMRLTDLEIAPLGGGSSSLYAITAGVAYGDFDLLCSTSIDPSDTEGGCNEAAPQLSLNFDWESAGDTIICKGGAGAQFCAYSHLSTTVGARFKPGVDAQ